MGIALIIFIQLGLWTGVVCYFDHLALRPLRWVARSRIFLNTLDAAFKGGQPVDRTLMDLAARGDRSMGIQFHAVAAWLRAGVPLHKALELVPRFLPRPLQALVIYGSQSGRLQELLPVGRRMMREISGREVNRPQGLIAGIVIGTALIGISGLLVTFVVPKFVAIGEDMGVPLGPLLVGLSSYYGVWVKLHLVVIGVMILFFNYVAGGAAMLAWVQRRRPRVADFVHRVCPWQGMRARERFAMMLARLLDLGLPEEEAVTWAGRFSGNRYLERTAAEVIGELRDGAGLQRASGRMKLGGDFEFRFAAAKASGRPLSEALDEWLEGMSVRAQLREKLVVEMAEVGFTVYNAAIVGLLAAAVFDTEIRLIDMASPW